MRGWLRSWLVKADRLGFAAGRDNNVNLTVNNGVGAETVEDIKKRTDETK